MSVRSWIGVALAVVAFGIFGYFVRGGCQLTAVAGLTFGGGLLFCGMLIDPAEFKSLLSLLVPFAKKGE